MFKILKENKIIGVSEQVPVLFDSYDVEEDTEHSVSDYEQYDGEYVLKSSVPVDYKNEQIRQQRQSRFVTESDPLYLDYVEAQARGDETVDEKKQLWLDKKDEIRAELPYVVEVKTTTKKRKKSSVKVENDG